MKDYVDDSKTEQTITDLLIEFDEMGFAPTTVCPNAEQYANDWRERVRKEFTRLTDENDNLTVELEVAQRDVENLTRTLDEANDEIKALEAENDELRATISKMETDEKELTDRLKNAVELLCRIGDDVYEVHGKCDGKNCPYNVDYGQWRCSYGGKRNCNPFITVNSFRYSDMPMVGKTIFVTKEAAEARLKEIKEENDD